VEVICYRRIANALQTFRPARPSVSHAWAFVTRVGEADEIEFAPIAELATVGPGERGGSRRHWAEAA
jgi:hypothetical protein